MNGFVLQTLDTTYVRVGCSCYHWLLGGWPHALSKLFQMLPLQVVEEVRCVAGTFSVQMTVVALCCLEKKKRILYDEVEFSTRYTFNKQ